MNIILGAVLLVMGLAGCAGLGLKETDTGWETTGKVAARVVLCPLTLCVSEIGIAAEAEREREARWYWSQSPEERARIDEMNWRRAQLFIGMGGFQGMRQPLPQIQYPPVIGDGMGSSRRRLTCTTQGSLGVATTVCE